MKKKIKVFQVGKYPQGEFSKEKIQQIFGNVKGKIESIFSHTSKWVSEGSDPVVVGEFNNFEINGDTVYGEIEFNDKGSKYYNDGILKGVSVEINNGVLSKIAVLPIGINPAIPGAEFEETESAMLNFEVITQLTAMEIVEQIKNLDVTAITDTEKVALLDAIWLLSDNKYIANTLESEGYTVTKVEMQQLTQEEMRALVRKEVEFETRRDCLKEAIKTKFRLPQHEIVEFAIEEAFKNRDTILEFSENEKTSMFERLEKTIEVLPKDSLFIEHHKEIEFSKENETENFFDKSKKETLKIFGGK